MHFSNENKSSWAGGFLYNPLSQSVLLHHRDAHTKYNPNRWALFGGLCRANEGAVGCFIRELSEEIGFQPRPDEVVPLRAHLYEPLETYRHVFFVCSAVNKSALRLGEGAGFEWIPIDKLERYDLTDLSRYDIEYFLTNFGARGSACKQAQEPPSP